MNSLGLETSSFDLDEAIPYSLIENYIFDISGLSSNKKMLLLMIRRYAGADRKPAYPSYNRLMKETGVNSPTTIKKGIDFFVWLHWLEKINRTNPDTKEKVNNFYIIKLKNIRLVLDHFKDKEYSFKIVEKYFEDNYYISKDKKVINTYFLQEECKFFK